MEKQYGFRWKKFFLLREVNSRVYHLLEFIIASDTQGIYTKERTKCNLLSINELVPEPINISVVQFQNHFGLNNPICKECLEFYYRMTD